MHILRREVEFRFDSRARTALGMFCHRSRAAHVSTAYPNGENLVTIWTPFKQFHNVWDSRDDVVNGSHGISSGERLAVLPQRNVRSRRVPREVCCCRKQLCIGKGSSKGEVAVAGNNRKQRTHRICQRRQRQRQTHVGSGVLIHISSGALRTTHCMFC